MTATQIGQRQGHHKVSEDTSYFSQNLTHKSTTVGTGIQEGFFCCSDPRSPVLGGVDVVAYFQITFETPAVYGNPEISHTLPTENGEYTFYFSNEENKKLFEESPWKYMPEFGGFDANALSQLGGSGTQPGFDSITKQKLSPNVDINCWAILNDRLFLFGYELARENFVSGPDQNTLISSVDLKWMNWFESRWVRIFSAIPNTVLNTQCING